MMTTAKAKPTCFFYLILITLHVIFASRAMAGRSSPDPLPILFEKGYAIVAATVIEAKPEYKGPPESDKYTISFKAERVVAEPISGPQLPIGADGKIQVYLSEGYGAEIEDSSLLNPGAKCYLTLLYHAGSGEYEHLHDSGAVQPVKNFTDADKKLYEQCRGLAMLPVHHRLDEWLDVVADAEASESFRLVTLSAINWKLTNGNTVGERGRDPLSALSKLWHDRSVPLSINLVEGLDYLQRSQSDFSDSLERERVWLDRMFAPTPENLKEDNNRDNLAIQVLHDLVTRHPEEVAPRLVTEMANRGWPPFFRRGMAAALMTAYCIAPNADSKYAEALEDYYATVGESGGFFELRVVAGDIKMGMEGASTGNRRSFTPNARCRAAWCGALSRCEATAKKSGPDQQEAQVAKSDVSRLLKAMDDANSQSPRKTLPSTQKIR